jgi:predicted HTH transcriptional regulator
MIDVIFDIPIKGSGRRQSAFFAIKNESQQESQQLLFSTTSCYSAKIIAIRIEMYRDRLEIISPGGLYGKITIDSLGKVHPDTRNAALANILELLDVTENRYSGIPTIRSECRMAGLPAPVFGVHRGEFKVTFRNNIFFTKLQSYNLMFALQLSAQNSIIKIWKEQKGAWYGRS